MAQITAIEAVILSNAGLNKMTKLLSLLIFINEVNARGWHPYPSKHFSFAGQVLLLIFSDLPAGQPLILRLHFKNFLMTFNPVGVPKSKNLC